MPAGSLNARLAARLAAARGRHNASHERTGEPPHPSTARVAAGRGHAPADSLDARVAALRERMGEPPHPSAARVAANLGAEARLGALLEEHTAALREQRAAALRERPAESRDPSETLEQRVEEHAARRAAVMEQLFAALSENMAEQQMPPPGPSPQGGDGAELGFDVSELNSFDVADIQRDHPCPICLEKLCEEKVSLGPCLHLAHTSCLIEWLATDATCPVCRVPFVEEP